MLCLFSTKAVNNKSLKCNDTKRLHSRCPKKCFLNCVPQAYIKCSRSNNEHNVLQLLYVIMSMHDLYILKKNFCILISNNTL